MADAAGDLGGDDGRARAGERLIDGLTRRGVVLDRPLHALNRLLCAVLEADALARRYLPERGLLAVACPIGWTIADRVPAGFVLPMVMPAAESKAVFRPDDLRANVEADGRE